jgi:hypothetical protein
MTLGEVFGIEPLMPSDMVKKLWVVIRSHGLGKK